MEGPWPPQCVLLKSLIPEQEQDVVIYFILLYFLSSTGL
jgi:hypothetical protein